MAGGLASGQRSISGLIANWAAIERRARLITDHLLACLWSNAAARADAAAHRDIRLDNGRLGHADAALEARLGHFVRACGAEPQSHCLPVAGGEGHILLRAQEIGRSAHARYIGITFHRTTDREAMRYADLESAFGLASGEHLLLLQLLRGQTAAQAASTLGISEALARTQMRRLYQRLNVTSRAALFRKLGAYQG